MVAGHLTKTGPGSLQESTHGRRATIEAVKLRVHDACLAFIGQSRSTMGERSLFQKQRVIIPFVVDFRYKQPRFGVQGDTVIQVVHRAPFTGVGELIELDWD